MRLVGRILVTLVLLGALAAGAVCYALWPTLQRQWVVRGIGAAESFERAKADLAWFELGPERDEQLRCLVDCWGRGNRQFDLYLVRYVSDRESSEPLRKAFSRELAWRDGLLPRWAQYWTWQARLEPDAQIASILEYLDTLCQVAPGRTITWREVLDLQAILTLAGQESLAQRLSPANWQDRYRQWLLVRTRPLPSVKRPAGPPE